jgi:hypothetical protein
MQINQQPDATVFQFIILTFSLEFNMFRAFSRPSSGAQWLQWQPLVLPSYRGDSRAAFLVGPADRPDHEHHTTVTTIRR